MRCGKQATYTQPDVTLTDVAELVDPRDPLQVEAASGTEMPYVGGLKDHLSLLLVMEC